MAEQKTFIFAVTFIILFSALVVSIPTDLSGAGSTADDLTPVNPALVVDFEDYVNFTRTSFFLDTSYAYNLGSYEFLCEYASSSFSTGAKIKWAGFLWLGAVSRAIFTNEEGVNRGSAVSITELIADEVEGIARYTLTFEGDGTSAGGFVFCWNTTTYTSPVDAWTADELYLVHGVGVESNPDVVALLLSLLFLQLPDCPVLINALLATPIWACVIYLLWFVIKESLPFV